MTVIKAPGIDGLILFKKINITIAISPINNVVKCISELFSKNSIINL